jgi:hypothetical protein
MERQPATWRQLTPNCLRSHFPTSNGLIIFDLMQRAQLRKERRAPTDKDARLTQMEESSFTGQSTWRCAR